MTQDNIFTISQYIFLITIGFDVIIFVGSIYYGTLKDKLQRIFIVTLLAMIVWEVALWATFFMGMTSDINTLLNRLAFASGPIIMIGVTTLLDVYSENKILPKYLYLFMWVLAAVIVAACMLGFVVEPSVRYGDLAYQFVLPPAIFYDYYYISFLPFAVIIIYLALKVWGNPENKTTATKYLLLGLLIAFIVGLGSNIIFPFLFRLNAQNGGLDYRNSVLTFTQTFGAIATTIWTSTTAYAIARHRLLGMHVSLERRVARIFLLIAISAVSTCLVWIFNLLFSLQLLVELIANALIIFFAILTTVQIFERRLIKPRYDLSRNDRPEYFDNIDQMLCEYYGYVKNGIETESALMLQSIYIYDYSTKQYVKPFIGDVLAEGNLEVLNEGDELSAMFLHKPEVYSKKILSESSLPTETQAELHQIFRRYSCDVIITLHQSNFVYGFLFLHLKGDAPITKHVLETLLKKGHSYGGNLQYILNYSEMVKKYLISNPNRPTPTTS